METAQPKKQSGLSISIWGALAGMVVTFLLGIYVGFHPNWIPVRGAGEDNFAAPAKIAMPATTEPADIPKAASTQPEASAH